jgi:cyclopropane-fatty-acyl-phospholipid synthase
MASQSEIESHYDTLGTIHALRLEEEHGGFPDYTCAYFNGDFSLSLKEAQEAKHSWIFKGLKLGQDLKGKKVLDIGCGWGPILNAARIRGGKAVGLTLSPGQVAHCKAHGLDARLKNYKELKPTDLPKFDGIISIGAFEHFCSVEEHLAGKQEEIYEEFFKICAKRLPKGGRLYLQTMIWGKHVPDYHKASLKANPHSEAAILARLEYFYPGSWLPADLAQIKRCAKKYFKLTSHNNGRLDYIETLKRWGAASKNLWKPKNWLRTAKVLIPLIWQYLTSHEARMQWEAIKYGDQTTCFKRQIMSHERMFFERI